MPVSKFDLVDAHTPDRIDVVREIFVEYSRSLPVDLCFQGFAEELAGLPGAYAPPSGRLLLVLDGGQAVGCGALRKFADHVCELKRMYVRPTHRGLGLGRRVAVELIETAQRAGYPKMRLDTLPSMTEAMGLYRSLGFKEISAYRFNPVEGHKQFELGLE